MRVSVRLSLPIAENYKIRDWGGLLWNDFKIMFHENRLTQGGPMFPSLGPRIVFPLDIITNYRSSLCSNTNFIEICTHYYTATRHFKFAHAAACV
jgi:hypothetical protein